MRDVRITLAEDVNALWARRSEWNALVERSATHTVFQTLEWHRSWWNALGTEAQAMVLVAEAQGELVGIAPLMLSVQRILGRKRRVVEFIGTHAADYCDFIVEPGQRGVASAMLAWLIDHADRWDLLHLINIAETSPLLEILPQMFGQRGYAADLHAVYECPTRIFGDRAADQRLSRKKDMRQHYNHLRRRGTVEFKLYVTAAEIERHLEAFFQQHIDRWAGTRTPSFFRDQRQRAFYRELVRRLAPNGWVVFSVLSLDGAPISFHFGYEYGGRIYVIKPTFDPQFREYAPGILQVKHLVEYAMERDAKELDFTVGEEDFKYRFANHTRVNYAARVHAHSMFYGIDRALVFAKAATRQFPALRRLGGRLLKPWLGESFHRLGL